ncbi:MAG: adenylate/guanylate cyclase domain-containing protein [Saprospiraceae bacterium]|nr:adenylate/guanylate cyclase domain-containing protein [Saprospiraceae bacterium]
MNTTPRLTTYFLYLIFISLPLYAHNQEDSSLQQNWQIYHEKGEYDKAIEQAKLIYELGRNTQNNEVMALALNWHGQSLVKKTKRASTNRKEAKKIFQQSLDLIASLDNKDLQLDNLRRLRELAGLEEDSKSYAIYDKRINEIENLLIASESNRVLSEQVQQLGGTLEILDSEKSQLQNKVASLSEAQTKAQLLISMQKNYLDSMKITRMQDSFQLATNELRLKEQTTQLALQENYIRLQSSQRNFFIAIAAILLLLAVGAYFRFTEVKKYNIALNTKNEALIAEQQRSENLLLNILPAMVADELKKNGVTKARRYEQATVMFVDFKEFSKIAKQLTPEQLVNELDLYFKAFDAIISKYKIEKIKTIGDAYMCVGGLPDVEGSEPKDVVLAGLEIQALLGQFKKVREKKDRPYFEARIGIHTGPLIAGVVGSMKFAYDIWGDTVNIAARLESNGQPWRVNISEATYALVKNDFEFETRGIIPIKNNTEIAMYFVNTSINYNKTLAVT